MVADSGCSWCADVAQLVERVLVLALATACVLDG